MGEPLDLVPQDITAEYVTGVGHRLLGGAGPFMDTIRLHHCLLRYGEASSELQQIVAPITDWIANSCPPWAEYRALMAVCLIGMDKQPGVRPVGIVETWRCYFSKCILEVDGSEYKESCGMEHICGGMEAGIEGGIRAMRLL